jgi:acetyltransferase-like isoleucine patch superfamily enzyme
VEIADGVEIGANVIILDKVRIEAGARIDSGAILGRISKLNRRSRSTVPECRPTVIEAGATVCAYALVTAGARMGPHSLLGDHAHVRDGVRLGTDVVVGTISGVGRNVVIGDRTRLQNNCVVGRETVIEEDCFLGPGAQLLTGRTMSASERKPPPTLRRGCQIGAGATILSGVEIGEEAIVGAGAIVTADVAPGTTVRGIPAREAAAALADVAQLG